MSVITRTFDDDGTATIIPDTTTCAVVPLGEWPAELTSAVAMPDGTLGMMATIHGNNRSSVNLLFASREQVVGLANLLLQWVAE